MVADIRFREKFVQSTTSDSARKDKAFFRKDLSWNCDKQISYSVKKKILIKIDQIFLRNTWPNQDDRIMPMTNLNNWTWPKLKQTNLNFTFGVRTWCFFLRSEARLGRCPSQCQLASLGWGTIFLWGKVIVCWRHDFRSYSIVKVCWCEKFSGHILTKFQSY